MLFSEKWLQNHPQFLLHFLIHIDVLMLCRKFELIRTKTFQVMAILKNNHIIINRLILFGSIVSRNTLSGSWSY